MARPPIEKRICDTPEFSVFSPIDAHGMKEIIELSVDEFETIRLIDLEGVSREECADRMSIARTTAQVVYNSARNKIARSIVYGMELHIAGGAYRLCDGSAGCSRCPRRASDKQKINFAHIIKEENIMRIAVTYENGQVFQHFGRTEAFKIFDVADNQVKTFDVLSSNGAGHGALAGVLSDNNVDVLICGGLGTGAMNALADAGIEVIAGASGDVDEAVKAYLAGELVSTGSNCHHHDHEEGHSCGSHGCGSHGCH